MKERYHVFTAIGETTTKAHVSTNKNEAKVIGVIIYASPNS